VIYRIIFTKPASRDLDQIGGYIDSVAGPAVARQFIEEIIGAAETLRTMPMRQRERTELRAGLRGIPVGNCMIFYHVHGDAVSIIRVLHGSRNITAKLFPPDRRRS
jgi:toxin ParE1/3/4